MTLLKMSNFIFFHNVFYAICILKSFNIHISGVVCSFFEFETMKMSNFFFFHSVIYAICILKSFNIHISGVVCSFFEFETVSKWYTREWVITTLQNECFRGFSGISLSVCLSVYPCFCPCVKH